MIDFDPERAVWRQIADDVRRKIAAGHYSAGSRLPSETDLTQSSGVSRTTIRTGIASLKSGGQVVVEQHAGHPRATYLRPSTDYAIALAGGPGYVGRDRTK